MERLEALYEKHRPRMHKRPVDDTWSMDSDTILGKRYDGIDWRKNFCPCPARAKCWHLGVARMADERLIPEGEEAMALLRQRSAERRQTRFLLTPEQVIHNLQRWEE